MADAAQERLELSGVCADCDSFRIPSGNWVRGGYSADLTRQLGFQDIPHFRDELSTANDKNC